MINVVTIPVCVLFYTPVERLLWNGPVRPSVGPSVRERDILKTASSMYANKPVQYTANLHNPGPESAQIL